MQGRKIFIEIPRVKAGELNKPMVSSELRMMGQGRILSIGCVHPDAVVNVDKEWAGQVVPVGSVCPISYEAELWDLRVLESDFQARDLLEFVPRLAELNLDVDFRLAALAAILADTATLHAAATHLAERLEWDTLLLRFDAIQRIEEQLKGEHFTECRSVFLRYLRMYLERLSQFGEITLVASRERPVKASPLGLEIGPFHWMEANRQAGRQEFRISRGGKSIGNLYLGRSYFEIRDVRMRIHREWRGRGWGRELLEQIRELAHGTPILVECYQDEGISGFLEKSGYTSRALWHRYESSLPMLAQSWNQTTERFTDSTLTILPLEVADRETAAAFVRETTPGYSRLPELELKRWFLNSRTTGLVGMRGGEIACVCVYRISGPVAVLQMIATREGQSAAVALGLVGKRALEIAMAQNVSVMHFEVHDKNRRVKAILDRLHAVKMRVRETWVSPTHPEN